MKTLLFLCVAAAVVLAATAVTAAADKANNQNCFKSDTWNGWSFSGDGDTLYLRVNRDIYRVDLAPKSHLQRQPQEILTNRNQGSDLICNVQDLQLALVTPDGFKEAVLTKSMRKLTPAEAAALPKEEQP